MPLVNPPEKPIRWLVLAGTNDLVVHGRGLIPYSPSMASELKRVAEQVIWRLAATDLPAARYVRLAVFSNNFGIGGVDVVHLRMSISGWSEQYLRQEVVRSPADERAALRQLFGDEKE